MICWSHLEHPGVIVSAFERIGPTLLTILRSCIDDVAAIRKELLGWKVFQFA